MVVACDMPSKKQDPWHLDVKDYGSVWVIRRPSDMVQLNSMTEKQLFDKMIHHKQEALLIPLLNPPHATKQTLYDRLKHGMSMEYFTCKKIQLSKKNMLGFGEDAYAIYEPKEPGIVPGAFGPAILHVARKVLGGALSPQIASYPESMRRFRNVEVLVHVKDERGNALWRSSKGSSFASAFHIALSAVRQRWTERSQVMGGPLETRLPECKVSVAVLAQDGVIEGVQDPKQLETWYDINHLVGLSHRGGWYYEKPLNRRVSVMKALEKLLEDQSLPAHVLRSNGTTFYRIRLEDNVAE